jgi:hypothetical protein
MNLDEFIELSAVLTGVSTKELPADAKQQTTDGQPTTLGKIHLDRLRASYPAELGALATAWQEAKATADQQAELRKRLARPEAADLRKAARQVIKIWYLTVIDDPRDATRKNQLGGDLEQYQRGTVWSLIKAQVQGYSNRQHGYWVSKPQ